MLSIASLSAAYTSDFEFCSKNVNYPVEVKAIEISPYPIARACRLISTSLQPQDERWSKLKVYPILQKVYLERILRKPEIDAFAEELKAHQIVNWRTHLKFPDEANLSPEAKDLIGKLLCNVEQRLGTNGSDELKAHPWFKGVEWDQLYQMEAAFIPEVNDELDTQNFEKFEETGNENQTSAKS